MNKQIINSYFKSVSKVLFGKEIGELEEFEPYLKETMFPYSMEKSSVSGKEVMLGGNLYKPNGKCLSQDEVKSFGTAPLSINDIKDIDSLRKAAIERFHFCGNKLFGTTINTGRVDNCIDSSDVYFSHNIYKVKRAAYCSYLREANHVFGVAAFPMAEYCMRCLEGIKILRGFETFYATNASDIYYSFNCDGCSECIFAYNLKHKKNIIGNLQLQKDQYLALKKKLVTEIANELIRKKRIFSIADVANYGLAQKEKDREVIMPDSSVPFPIEKAFNQTSKLVLEKELHKLSNYKKWLSNAPMRVKKVKGAKGTVTFKTGFPISKDMAASRLLPLDKALASSANHIQIKENEQLTLQEIVKRVAKTAYFTHEYLYGRSDGTVDTPCIFDAVNTFGIWDGTNAKLSAYGTWVIESEYMFGGHYWLLQSKFCINIHDSTNLTMCLETDSSYSSKSCYFCHNVENCENCLFCFNVKGLRYAVCNQEVGKEQYSRVKKILLDYIHKQLEKSKTVDFDIFTIAKWGRKK